MYIAVFGSFHYHFAKNREWVSQKQAFYTPSSQKPGKGFSKTKLFPLPPAKIPGMVFTQTSFFPPSASNDGLNDYCDLPGQLAMPLSRTPRSVNSRCRRKATPSEGSICRSERRSERSACVPERESVARGHTRRHRGIAGLALGSQFTAALRTGQTSKRTT